MEQLIDFTELQQVLQDLANDIRDNYKEHLQFNDRWTDKGVPPGYKQRLIDSVTTQVVVGDRAFEVSMTLNEYWKYVEKGLNGDKNPASPYKNPGWDAFPHILNWVKIKPVIPRPNSSGRIPTPKELAFLITRAIVQNGTQGTFDLKAVKDGVIPWYKEKIAIALGHDMENYIRKIVVEK